MSIFFSIPENFSLTKNVIFIIFIIISFIRLIFKVFPITFMIQKYFSYWYFWHIMQILGMFLKAWGWNKGSRLSYSSLQDFLNRFSSSRYIPRNKVDKKKIDLAQEVKLFRSDQKLNVDITFTARNSISCKSFSAKNLTSNLSSEGLFWKLDFAPSGGDSKRICRSTRSVGNQWTIKVFAAYGKALLVFVNA